jgi:hypothetical protein
MISPKVIDFARARRTGERRRCAPPCNRLGRHPTALRVAPTYFFSNISPRREHVGREIIDLLPPRTLTVTHDELGFKGRALDGSDREGTDSCHD